MSLTGSNNQPSLNLNFNLASDFDRPKDSFNFNADYAKMLLNIQMACSNNPFLLDSMLISLLLQ